MRKQVEQRTVEESAERFLSLMKRKSKIKIAVEMLVENFIMEFQP